MSAAGKYVAVLGISAREAWRARAESLVRAGFFVVLLLVFSRLWTTLRDGGAVGGPGAATFVWYLALTEWITLAPPLLFLRFEDDVRSGDVAYGITRPVSYLWMRFFEGFGTALVRLAVLAVLGVAAAWLCAGRLPADPRGLLLALPLGVLACAVHLLVQTAVGLSAFWLQETSPLYWIVQKLMFVLGGLLFPLEIYPGWLAGVAEWTPFAPILHGCGAMAFGFDPARALATGLKIVGWGLALAALVTWLYRRGLRALDVNGG